MSLIMFFTYFFVFPALFVDSLLSFIISDPTTYFRNLSALCFADGEYGFISDFSWKVRRGTIFLCYHKRTLLSTVPTFSLQFFFQLSATHF